MSFEMPPLLKSLQATVDDERLFDMSGTDDPVRCRRRLKEAFLHLYENAAWSWNFIVLGTEGDKPELRGVLLFEEYDELVGCGIEEFRDAIRFVADGRVVTRMGVEVVAGQSPEMEVDDRAFLYFMLGYAAQGYEEAIRSGRFTGGRNYKRAD